MSRRAAWRDLSRTCRSCPFPLWLSASQRLGVRGWSRGVSLQPCSPSCSCHAVPVLSWFAPYWPTNRTGSLQCSKVTWLDAEKRPPSLPFCRECLSWPCREAQILIWVPRIASSLPPPQEAQGLPWSHWRGFSHRIHVTVGHSIHRWVQPCTWLRSLASWHAPQMPS